VVIENATARVVLSTLRGAVKEFQLKDSKAIVLPKHLAQYGKGLGDGPLPVLRAFQDYGYHDWLMDDQGSLVRSGLQPVDQAAWVVASHDASSAVFTHEIAGRLRWRLACRMHAENPTMSVELTITNLGAAPVTLAPLLAPLNGIHHDYPPSEIPYSSVFDHTGGSSGSLETYSIPAKDPPDPKNWETLSGSAKNCDFIGLKSRFFAAWWSPQADAAAAAPAPLAAPKPVGGPSVGGPNIPAPAAAAAVPAGTWTATAYGYTGYNQARQALIVVEFAGSEVQPGADWHRGWSISAASMTRAALAKLSDSEKQIEYTDGMYRFFKILAKGLTWILDLLAMVVHQYGVAVILLTILIKAALHRTTFQQQASMLKMQKLSPELKYIKEQYKGNQQEQAKKQMELFKKHGVHPMGGCLPMLIQIPIFFALFQAFSHNADLRGTSFLWIHDLTLPDQLWGVRLPWLPFWDHILSLNPLPIIYIASSAWMSFSQKPPANADPQQEAMYKMMRWLPVIFGLIFYNMPSGLVLYFTVQAIISTLEMKYIRRKLGIT
jgi:YidC/Oxa1 family membrane protein insertase